MDWSSFNLHDDAPERAFEALTGILFERWCHREFSSQLRQVVFVNGAGGDGGVEAYAQLINGQMIGLQAKWFREPLESSQISQIKDSLATAASVRSGLVRYVVAIPRDLGDVKTKKRAITTERQRWDNFVNDAQTVYPTITIGLWGETQITELLAELGSEGLQRYWFDGSVADSHYLCLKFEQALSGWLNARYVPDLHQLGQIEDDLKLRLDGPATHPSWLHEASRIRRLLEDAHTTVLRLRRYPQFMERADAEALIKASEEWFIAAIAEQQELEKRVAPANAFPLPDFENEVTDAIALHNLVKVLLPEGRKTSDTRVTDSIGKQLQNALEQWDDRKVTPRKLQDLGQPVAYIGKPGVGKTHALTNAVQKQLAEGKPAILMRARDIELTRSWDSLLAEAVGELGWNLRQVLDMLEAAAVQAEVRMVAKSTDTSIQKPVRALVAIDGLDESTRAERWAEKLGELQPLAQRYPRMLFACSLRQSLSKRMSIPMAWDIFWLDGSDASLGEVFKAYCNVNRIECPPLLRWALQTPLAIKLFADLYQGQRIDSISLQQFSLMKLMLQKINHAERSIREDDEEGWSDTITPVKNSLRAIAKACLSTGQAISQEEALQVVEEAQKTKGVLSRLQLLRIFHKCRDYGLLLLRSQPSDGPFEEEIYTWEPAYETLTNFLLAWEAYDSVKVVLESPDMPAYLRSRGEAITLAVSLLGKDGYNFLASGLWSNDLDEREREDLQLTAILTMTSQQGATYQDRVQKLFTQNMPNCRQVLERLVLPGLRIPGFVYGARFIHDTLLPMRVAERDLFWSGPNQLPHNHGACWEGYGSTVLENLELADDDLWDSAPLLLAWATTTVDNDNRRRIRVALAFWGSHNPDGLLALLETAFPTNDPQMKEDLLSVAYGASCLTRPDETWLPLCNWIIDSFFISGASHRTHDVIVRHCARSLIERCVACHVPVDEERLVSVRVPHVNKEELLCIDTEAAINAHEEHGIEPAKADLAWYVVPRVLDPFFAKSCISRVNRSDNEITDEEIAEEYEDVEDAILHGFVEGRLRKSADVKTRQYVKEMLEALAARQAHREAELAEVNETANELLEQWRQQMEEGSEESKALVTQDTTPSHPKYSPSAQALLEQHAAAYALQNLTPNRLAFGFIAAYASRLGWSRDIFIKDPRGGKPGEIIGADIAILRQYSQARHGNRSSIATFAEKYVWAATNELFGFLADRVAAYCWNNCYGPPVDLSLLAEATNPAADVSYRQLTLDEVLELAELVPDTELSEPDQVERANEWVQQAPLPRVESLLLPVPGQLPKWARNHDWLLLRVFAIGRHLDSQAESAFWASSFLYPSSASLILEEDARTEALTDLHEFCWSVAALEFYRDPCEAVWAPWIQEEEGLIRHSTLDLVGRLTTLHLQAATCGFYWRSPDGEAEEWIPAKWLRRALGIVDFHAGRFLTASGDVLAFTYNVSGEAWRMPRCQALFGRRDAILQALNRENLSLGWGVRVYREPSYPLNIFSRRQKMFRDWRATVFWSSDALTTIPQQDVTKPWS